VNLRSSPKTSGLSRTVPPDETARRVRPLARRLGVTRLSDITGLDRVGIPTFSAIVPDSGDLISVYTGKGARRADAKAGALMEAIERQSALKARPSVIEATFEEVRRRAPTVDPRSLVTALAEDYSDQGIYEWVEGYDLLNDCATLVPAAFAGYRWTHLRRPSPLRFSTTHGLSAGNCLEETVSQSLCEWIERDAWTLAEVACHWRPRAILEALTHRDPGIDFVDDLERFPCLSLDGIGEPVGQLLSRFHAAGLQPVIRSLTSDLGIAVILTSVAADDAPGFPQVHMGIGAHPDLRVAASRALTEAAQSRCGDIQAVREDLEQADGTSVSGHTRRVAFIDRRRWILGRSTSLHLWRDIPDYRHHDIVDDIRLILARLRAAGIQQAVMVDLSPPDSGVVVLRAVIPGLETWVVDHGRLGERAASQFRHTAARTAHA
jgi:ribosomal protein S12 methylthiotransferase accessory factor